MSNTGYSQRKQRAWGSVPRMCRQKHYRRERSNGQQSKGNSRGKDRRLRRVSRREISVKCDQKKKKKRSAISYPFGVGMR